MLFTPLELWVVSSRISDPILTPSIASVPDDRESSRPFSGHPCVAEIGLTAREFTGLGVVDWEGVGSSSRSLHFRPSRTFASKRIRPLRTTSA